MRKSVLMSVVLVILAIMVAACGSAPAATSGGTTGGASAGTPASGSAGSQPAAASQNEELAIKHQLGEAKVKKNPKTVVVFDYGVLDSLDKLGVEVTGVPQSNLPPYLAKYKDAKYKNIGTLMEPDYEKLSALKPDVIFISGRQQNAYPELNKLAPTIFAGVDNKKFMESFTENMKMLGKVFGKESAVDAELAKIETTVKGVKEKAAASGKNALVLLANDGALSAYGPGSRFGIIHDVLGITAVDKNIEVSTHGQSVTFEYVAQKNPDYLFVVDRGAAVGGSAQSPAKQLIENELVKKTKAFTNNGIVYLDPGYWYLSGGGLVSVSEMVNQVAAAFK